MLQSLIIGIVLLFVAVLLMGVRVFFTKKGEFPNIHIGSNKAMQARGIHCASSQDAEYNQKENPVEKLLKNENL